MCAASPTPRGLTSVLTTPLAWIFLMAVAFTTTTAAYALPDAAAIALLYGLFALALVAGVRVLGAFGLAGRLAGAALAGLVLAWHMREQTRIEGSGATLWTREGVLQFLPLVTLIAGVVLLLEVLRGRGHEHELRRQMTVLALGTATFSVVLAGVFHGTATARWHLIRHNRMIGTVAFHAFATPVERIEAERWAAHRNGAPLGQPQWVLELDARSGPPTGEAQIAGTGGGEPEAAAAGANLAAAAEMVETAVAQDERFRAQTAAAMEEGGAASPDIVFVMLDTLRADGLAAYGADPGLMPGLNDLAARATVFTDVLANAPWTQPSVASMFTGVHAEEHGVISYPYRMSANVVTLAEVVRARGYRTAAFVANAVIANPDSGFVRGFDTFEYVGDPALTYARADTVTDRVATWLTRTFEERTREPGDATDAGVQATTDGAAHDGVLEAGADDADPAQDAIVGHPPLFLYVHYFDPHVPYLSSNLSAAQQASQTVEEARRYYADELRFLDREVARLIETIDRRLPRSTLFVTSDHGEELGEHDGLGHSQTLYSEVLHIPALLRLSGIAHSARGVGAAGGAGGAPGAPIAGDENTAAPATGGVTAGGIDAPLEGRDFFDLLVRLAAGEPLDPVAWAASNRREARVASLYFEKDPGRSVLVHHLLRPYRSRIFNRMIERDGWRYVFSAFGPTDELYDLGADPGEIRNLAGDEAARVAALRAELEETPPYWVQLVPLQLSDEALENLRQLGYIR